ncbi:MAG: FAD-dependent oxidoreductase [Alphaproteobacteria bacterium]|nr:FAD-dependent oxidoreductase [Alphaproteobacteria bacterium]
MSELYLKQPQLKAELEKCLQCKTKPCKMACPVSCSPCDFIRCAKEGDFNKAAEEILRQNPLGEVCGLICPDKFCMKACVRANLDAPIKIPAVQAAIMQKANEVYIDSKPDNGKKIAVVGLGPAGIGAVAEALKQGFSVDAFEKESSVGGALNLIPNERLPKEVLQKEWQRISNNPRLKVHFSAEISDYNSLLNQGYEVVVVALGEQKSRKLGIDGEQFALDYTEYLKNPQNYTVSGHVMIVGGGAAAVDCALTAVKQGAKHTEMLVRRGISNMRITAVERDSLLQAAVDITAMTKPLKIEKNGDKVIVDTIKTEFDEQGKLVEVADTVIRRKNIDLVITALGSDRAEELLENAKIIYVGDFITGGSTAVQAVADGKKAIESIVANES